MTDSLSILEILGIAASVSLLAGWRLYLCVLATGAAMHYGLLPLPEHLQSLRILADPWVMGIAAFAAFCEFFADKVAWVDSLWDAVHTVIRPVGGALLALAVVDPSDPATQVIAFLLGGGASLLAHGSKAGARALINASPEPFSNIAASAMEDIVSVGLLYLAYQYPVMAAAIASILFIVVIALLVLTYRILGRLFARGRRQGSAA